MAGRYGMSFARKHIDDGDYEEAIAAATKEIAEGDVGPEILVDRAAAYELAERFAEAVADFERAIELDATAHALQRDLVDDAYFSALLACARDEAARSVDLGVKRLDRYADLFPKGAHIAEAAEWKRRLRGELVSTLDKTTDM
jgi:tetratricopeptide (TPR) repeat protein